MTTSRLYDFEKFLLKTHKKSGKVRECPLMDDLTRRALDVIHKEHSYHEIKDVIDIGCGVGRDMDIMRNEHNKHVVGVTVSEDDAVELRQRGYEIFVEDQNFLPGYLENQFDMVWSRHCLEHSLIPFYTLHKYFLLLRDNGVCYLEVPGAELQSKQETNPNHYSVLGQTMLKELIARTGFQILDQWSCDLDYTLQDGSELKDFDRWFCYVLRKVPILYDTL